MDLLANASIWSQASKMTVVDPNDLNAIEKSVADAATQGRTAWLAFITFGAYLAVGMASITDLTLLLLLPMRLPVLNVDLPFFGFAIIAPMFLLMFHSYMILQLDPLARKTALYYRLLSDNVQISNDRRRILLRLDSFIFVQLLFRVQEHRMHANIFLIRSMTIITVVIAPLLLLLQTQIRFLPYHSAWLSWSHRVMILGDITLLWCFWPVIRYGENFSVFPSIRNHWAMYFITLVVALFSVFVAVFPGEWIEVTMQSNPIHKSLFGGNVDLMSGRLSSIFANVLVLPGLDLTEDRTYMQRRLSLVGRDLRGVILIGSNLPGVDVSGSNLSDGLLVGANLERAHLRNTVLRFTQLAGANLGHAQLEGALLVDANLRGANLQGADLDGTNLQGADLDGANLQGANLRGANFYGASLLNTRR